MPTAVTVILAVLLFLLLLPILPVHLTIKYREDLSIKAHLLCFSFTLYPKAKKPMQDTLALIRAILAVLYRKMGKRLRLRAARVHIRVATGDAATTAMLYGAVCATLSYLLAFLDRFTRLKTTEESTVVVADYLAQAPSADVKLVLSMRVWAAIVLLARSLHDMKQRKQKTKDRRPRGARKEPSHG